MKKNMKNYNFFNGLLFQNQINNLINLTII